MEEQERFTIGEFDTDWELGIVDNKLGKSLSFVEIKNVLNIQDKRIKELEGIIEDNSSSKFGLEDKVYAVSTEGVIEFVINAITLCGDNDILYHSKDFVVNEYSVFATREEAEAMQKELDG